MNRKATKKHALIFPAVLLSIGWFGCTGLYSQSRNSDQVAIELLMRLDKNQDGFLTAEEIPARSRVAIATVAKNSGIKINARKGISIEKLQKQLRKKEQANKKGNLKKQAKEKNKDGKKGNGTKQEKLKAEKKPEKSGKNPTEDISDDQDLTKSKSAPKSFGVAETTTSTKGFGTPSKIEAPPKEAADGSEGTTEAKKNPKKDKYARFAASLMRRHDKNKSGVLEKNEWQKLGESTKEFDFNADGVLDQSELRAKLVGFSTSASNSSSNFASNKLASTPKKKKRSKARSKVKRDSNGMPRSYRFKTAHERVLDKVPDADWFVRLDRNEDGQIEMSEYASKWNATTAKEFMDKDLNNDGIITPAELQ